MGNMLFIILTLLSTLTAKLVTQINGVPVRQFYRGSVRWTLVGSQFSFTEPNQSWYEGHMKTYYYSWGWPWGSVTVLRQPKQIYATKDIVTIDLRVVKCTRK